MLDFATTIVLSFASIILIFIVIAFMIRKKRPVNHFLNKLTGPPPNFLFGNVLELMGPTSKLLEVFHSWLDTHGDTAVARDGPFSPLVGTKDVKFTEYILSSTKLITKAPQYDYFHSWLGTGLLTSTDSKHKSRRRLLTPAFHFSILENFIDVFDSVSDIFVKKLECFVGQPSLDIYPLVSLCTLDIICETAMGTKINAQFNENSKYVQSVKIMCSILTQRNFSALNPTFYPFTLNYLREKSAIKTLHAHSNGIIDKRIKTFQNSQNTQKVDSEVGMKKKQVFLDLLIQAKADGASLSREDIREEVDTFMFEGHDTTSSALSFCLYSLANNPDVQKKAFAELKEIFSDRDIKSAKTTMTDLQNMKYLELVIKETLRLYPSVPFFGRIVTEDFEYDGIFYPKNTRLFVFPLGSQRNPKYFPEPDKFIPERFLDMQGVNPYAYVPFSAGPRNCIGQKFAMLELKSTVSKVLRHFELLPATPNLELELAPEIILISKNGINLSLQRRTYE